MIPAKFKDTQTLMQDMDNVCQKLPKAAREQCRQFILENEENLKTLKKTNVLGEKLCATLKLCGENEYPELMVDKLCRSCLKIAERSIPKVMKNEDKMEYNMKKLVKRLPKKYREDAESVLLEKTHAIEELNAEGELGRHICEASKMCVSKPCYSCKETIHQLRKSLPWGFKPEHIANISERLCSNIHESYHVDQKHCVELMNNIVHGLNTTVSEKHSEEILCRDLGLCK
ncbi:hypothetical protein GEMRC1_014199 [Eukaryota sp. GEM-RC1]